MSMDSQDTVLSDLQTEKDVIYVVPHTHYDAVWVFTKEDYFYINIDFILKKVIEIMEKHPEYKFLIEQTFLLEEIENRYPELFEKIRKYVKEGRIEIADGEYLMPDTMLPQEETLVREILVGKWYLRKKFGFEAVVMWQADGFGLNAQLPQIYTKSGYRYVAFRRGYSERSPSEFLWEGLDGTRIIAHSFPLGYRAGLYISGFEDSYRVLKECAFGNHILMPSGSGSTPPQEEVIDAVERWNRTHESSEMKIATPVEFFREVEKYADKLPVRKCEMYCGKYSPVFPDTSSSRIWIKMNQRELESGLLTLERFDTISHLICGFRQEEEIENCWKKILFNAFHDVIPGTGADDGYTEVKYNIDFLRVKIPHLLNDTIEEILKCCDGEYSGDFVVFNPLSWEVENWVEVDLSFDKGKVKEIRGVKSGKEERKVEVIKESRYYDGSVRYAKIGFVAKVPPLGFRTYRIIEYEPAGDSKDLKEKANVVSNKFFNVYYSPENGLIMVFKDGEEIFVEGNEIVIDSEAGNLYHHIEDIDTPVHTEGGEGIRFGRFDVENISVERTPLRFIINVATRYYSLIWPYRLTDKWKPVFWRHNYITINKKIIIYKDLPRIDFITVIDNRHPRTRIRARFKTKISNDCYACETQFGTVSRRTNMYYFNPEGWAETPSGVYPSLRWIDYSDGSKGLTIVNRGNPENEVRDNYVYITLLRSVDLLSHGKEGPVIPVPDAMELKRYEFHYSAYPHEGDWKRAKSYRIGYEFNYRLIPYQVSVDKKLPESMSFVRVTPDSVILTALKTGVKAEDNEAVIRVYEAEGEGKEVKIEFFKEVESVKELNLIEDEVEGRTFEVDGNTVKFRIGEFEIVTFKVKFSETGKSCKSSRK